MSENTHRDSILNTEVNVYNSIEERKLMNTQKVQLLSFVKPNLAFANQLETIEEILRPKDLIIMCQIGSGSFGVVYLVQSKRSHQYYALKIINKVKIKTQSLKKYAVNERKILSMIQHQFIVPMKLSFETKTHLFLVLEYCGGKDLSKYLDEEG